MLFYIESIQIDGSPIIWSKEDGDATAFCTFCVRDKTKNPNKDRFMAATKEVSPSPQGNGTISITIHADTPCIEVKDHATIKRVHLQRGGDDLATWRQRALSHRSLFSSVPPAVAEERDARPQSLPELLFNTQPSLFDRLTENIQGETICYEETLPNNNQHIIASYSKRMFMLEADLLSLTKALRYIDILSLKRSQVQLMRQIIDSLIQPAAESLSGTLPIKGNIKPHLINAIIKALRCDQTHTQPSSLESSSKMQDSHTKVAPRPPNFFNQLALTARVNDILIACLDFAVFTDAKILPENLTTDNETIVWLTAMRREMAPNCLVLKMLLDRFVYLTACLGIMEATYKQWKVTNPIDDLNNCLGMMTKAKSEQLLGFALGILDPLDQLQSPTIPELSRYCSVANHLVSLFQRTKTTFNVKTVLDSLRSILIEKTNGQNNNDNPFAPLLPKVKLTNRDSDFYLREDWLIGLGAKLAPRLADKTQTKQLTCADLANAIWQFIQEKSLAILDASNQSTQVATCAPSRV